MLFDHGWPLQWRLGVSNHKKLNFFQQLVQANIKEDITWLAFYEGNSYVTDSPHKGPIIPKVYPWHGVLSYSIDIVSNHSWWRHQMETFSVLLAICAGNSPVTGEFPAQRPVTRSVGVFFDLRLNKRLSKQSWDWWFETPPCPLWRHCNVLLGLEDGAQRFPGRCGYTLYFKMRVY